MSAVLEQAAAIRPEPQAISAEGAFPRILLRMSGEWLVWILLAAAVFIIAIVPLLYTIDASFYEETRIGLSNKRDLTAFLDVYAGAEYLQYLAGALWLAFLVTAFSMIVGVAMAVLMARTDIPFKGTLDLLIIMPLFLSPFTGLIAWIALGSAKTGFINVTIAALFRTFGIEIAPLIDIWSFGGAVWVMFVFFCPFAYLFTVGNLKAMDASLEEAARMSGASPLQALLKITLPMALPAILASGLLIFILSAEMYTIPGIIGSTAGFTTLPWQIYQDSTAAPIHRAHAAAAGTMLLWVTILGVWLQRRITRHSERYVSVGGKGIKGREIALGRGVWLAMSGLGLYIMCADILPFGAILLSSFMKFSAPTITADILTTLHYRQIFELQDIRVALWNTMWLAVLCGAGCVVVGLLISYMEVRRPHPATKALAFLGVLPVAVPGLVYGIGLLWTYVGTPVYGTAWILLLAYLAKFLPYGIVVSRSAIIQIHPDLEQSARMCGASGLTALRKITMPLLKPTLIAILFFVMLMSIKELSASILLYSQRSQILSVLTWHYMDAGNYQFASALGVLQTILMIALVVITRAIFKVRLEQAMAK